MSGSRSWVKGQCQISGMQRSILGARLCQVQQRAMKCHYQSKEFVCVSNCRADAVDRLLFLFTIENSKIQLSTEKYGWKSLEGSLFLVKIVIEIIGTDLPQNE